MNYPVLAQDTELVDFKYMLAESDSILKIMPTDCTAKFNRAVALRHFGKYNEAIVEITYVIENCESISEAYYFTRARIYQKAGMYNKAISDYIKTISLMKVSTNSWNEHFQVGFCFAQLNKFAEAKEWYTIALEKAPDEGIIYYNRGLTYYSLNDKHAACADFGKALSLGVLEAGQTIKDICF